MRSSGRRQGLVLAACVAAVLAGTVGPVPTTVAQNDRGMGPMPGMPQLTREAPIYRQPAVVVLVGLAVLGAGFVAYRLMLARRGRPVRAFSEAVLVVDLVESTRLATHWGDTVAMRARNTLKDRALSAARAHGLAFAESTSDGWFMTFPSTAAAVESAADLLGSLRKDPPDVAPAPPLEARAAVTYGEILRDAQGNRHGATINKAFRLMGLSPASFARVESADGTEGEISDRDRILLDEEAAQELGETAPLRHFVGFASLKGFAGLHRVYEVDWSAP